MVDQAAVLNRDGGYGHDNGYGGYGGGYGGYGGGYGGYGGGYGGYGGGYGGIVGRPENHVVSVLAMASFFSVMTYLIWWCLTHEGLCPPTPPPTTTPSPSPPPPPPPPPAVTASTLNYINLAANRWGSRYEVRPRPAVA
ncbi:metacaspase-1-like [Homarus americanus]|uniref:metacaspase-1-like n=1 Tax=Homarus americanus TaxID=6706 RepID=UPI001C45EE20|nr:metacaspase-1-like [Homarus americanus]